MHAGLTQLIVRQRPRKLSFVLLLAITLGAALLVKAQITITEINPSQSTLDSADPAGASGGRVNGLAIDPRNDSILYAASEWGGIYKSIDAGRTWSRLDRHLPTVTWDVEVSPGDSNRVIATSFYDGRVNSLAGINVSSDGGATWTHPASATPPMNFCAPAASRDEPSAFGISFDPEQPQNVFVGTNCGVAISNDGGNTWRYRNPTRSPGAKTVWDVVVHHRGIIDLCGDDGHRRSTTGGISWTGANVGGVALPAGQCSITVSPDESYVLFATDGGRLRGGGNIFESDDGGGSWNTSFTNPRPQGRIPFVATNQRAGRAFDLWFGDVSLFRAGCTTPVMPSLGGAARCPPSNLWVTGGSGAHDDMGDVAFGRPRNPPRPNPNCLRDCDVARERCISRVRRPGALPAKECNQIFNECSQRCNPPRPPDEGCPVVVATDGGVYFNTRTVSPACQTAAWEQPNVTPHGLLVFGMDGAGQSLYFANQDNGVFATANAAGAVPAWSNIEGYDSYDIVADTTQVVYSTCCSGGAALFSRNAGMMGGVPVSTPPGGLHISGFPDVLDRFGANRYVVISEMGVFISTTNPINWAFQLGAATSPPRACSVQAAGPSNNPTFIVQAGTCLGSSQDSLFRFVGTGGGTWQRILPPRDVGGFGIFAVDPNNPSRILVSRLGASRPEMMITSDGGVRWTPMSQLDALMTGNGLFQYQNTLGPTHTGTGFDGYVQPTLVAFDPNDASTLLAGGSDSGIFLSTDNGATWNVVTDNSGPPLNPHISRPRFAYFSRERGTANIYIGTQGRGIWRLSYPDRSVRTPPPPPPPPRCTQNCDRAHDQCLLHAGERGMRTRSQCAQEYTRCYRRCLANP